LRLEGGEGEVVCWRKRRGSWSRSGNETAVLCQVKLDLVRVARLGGVGEDVVERREALDERARLGICNWCFFDGLL